MIVKYKYLVLALIIFLGFLARLYRFDNQIADWHSWRQADTSAVSRNFVKNGFDILHPKFDDLSNVASGKDNPNGYRFVEFPIYNVFSGGLYTVFGRLSLEQWERIVTIISSLLSSVFIYSLVKKYLNITAGILSSFFFIFLPFNIYFSRTILPDETTAMAILGGIYFFDQSIGQKSNIKNQISRTQIKDKMFFILSIVFTASSFLLKPYALFFTLPIIYLSFKTFGLKLFLKWQLWIFAILTLAPLIFWRIWMQQYVEGIPVSDWLFNGGGIRFKPSFFYWIFADRIGKLILGYWGVFVLGIGLIRKLEIKNKLFFFSFLASSLSYIFVIAKGNVQHDYYQVLIMPTIAIFLGLGGEFLLNPSKEYFSKASCFVVLIIFSAFTLFFGWFFVKDYFNINDQSIVIAGKAVDLLTPKNAKVIAPYEGNTAFLYQTNRQGWASFEKPLTEMINMGANYLVLSNPTENDFKGFGRMYKIISATKDYMILDLSKKP